MASVTMENVNKYYYSSARLNHAVINLNMEIEDGELVSIVGPSGCGKTSTMRMIAGLEGVTQGKIFFDGNPINHLSPAQRNVALSFESYALYQHMTVKENIQFCLKVKNLSPQEMEKQCNWIVGLLGIHNILDQKPANLSGGQQQLVSLARALSRTPSVTLLDEPISHLDGRARQDVSIKIREIHNQLGLTMIYVTHNQEEAFALADRVAVMNFGELQQIGTRQEIIENPVNMFVAEFIGEPSMNFIPCQVSRQGETLELICHKDPAFHLPAARKYLPALHKGQHQRIIIGIRPIACRLEEFRRPDDCKLTGQVLSYEHLGEKSFVKIHALEQKISADISSHYFYSTGDTLSLYVNPQEAIYFDEETGNALPW